MNKIGKYITKEVQNLCTEKNIALLQEIRTCIKGKSSYSH